MKRRWWTPRAQQRSPGQVIVSEALILVTVIAVLVALAWVFWVRVTVPHEGPMANMLGDTIMAAEDFDERCGEARAEPFVVTYAYSPDKAPWIEAAATSFMRSCPNTQIKLVSVGDIEAAKAIATGELRPTVWAPSDSLFLDYLDARWQQAHPARPLIVERGASLLRSPIVLLVWRDRLEVLERLLPAGAAGSGSWAAASCAGIDRHSDPTGLEREAMVPSTWIAWWRAAHPAPAQLPPSPPLAVLDSWGRVRVAHASPTRSTVGLAALVLIAHDYLGAQDLDRPQLAAAITDERGQLQRWLRRCEAGQAMPLDSGRLLTETMFNLGEPGLDAVITDEHLALTVLDRINDHEAALRSARVVYPRTSLVLDHPELMFGGEDPQVLLAARRFSAYLREPAAQTHALELGFRPVGVSPSMQEYDLGPNPFTRLRRHGAMLDPDILEPARPDGASVVTLLELWASATGRN